LVDFYLKKNLLKGPIILFKKSLRDEELFHSLKK
jgi:hypothetical protein